MSVRGLTDRLAGCAASARHLPTSCFAHSTRSTPASGPTSTRAAANGSYPSPGRRVPFPPAVALLCRPCRLWLFCPLVLQHLFDPLEHLIVGLKLGCVKLGESGDRPGAPMSRPRHAPSLRVARPGASPGIPPTSIKPPRFSPASLFPEPRPPDRAAYKVERIEPAGAANDRSDLRPQLDRIGWAFSTVSTTVVS